MRAACPCRACGTRPDAHGIARAVGIDLDGKEVVVEGEELMGRCIQHECDHLEGHLYPGPPRPQEPSQGHEGAARAGVVEARGCRSRDAFSALDAQRHHSCSQQVDALRGRSGSPNQLHTPCQRICNYPTGEPANTQSAIVCRCGYSGHHRGRLPAPHRRWARRTNSSGGRRHRPGRTPRMR